MVYEDRRPALIDRYASALQFSSPRHFGGVLAKRLLSPLGYEGPVTIALSVYPPGAGAEETMQETDVVYVILEGALEVTCDGERNDLGRYDSVAIGRGSTRSIHNVSARNAHLLVLRPRA